MSRFMELAKIMAEKQMSDVDSQIAQIQGEKNIVNETFDQQLSQLKMIKTGQKTEKSKIDAAQKQDKLQKDLIKMMVDQGGAGTMAVGGTSVDQFAGVEMEPEAAGLPILGEMQI